MQASAPWNRLRVMALVLVLVLVLGLMAGARAAPAPMPEALPFAAQALTAEPGPWGDTPLLVREAWHLAAAPGWTRGVQDAWATDPARVKAALAAQRLYLFEEGTYVATGCNTRRGQFALEGAFWRPATLEGAGGISTLMACEPWHLAADAWVNALLAQPGRWRWERRGARERLLWQAEDGRRLVWWRLRRAQ